ncbi:MAG: SPOR domain-containing protein [Bacteroidota bacterium]
MRSLLIIALSVVSLSGFAQKNSNKPIQEDLASIRPHFAPPLDTGTHYAGNPVKNVPVVKPVMTVNQKVDFVLDSIDKLKVTRKMIPGYTILVYSGLNSEEARNARRRLQDELSMKADMQYIQPKWRVRVGNYFTSLDAQKDLMRLKRAFPNAILVPESVPIR